MKSIYLSFLWLALSLFGAIPAMAEDFSENSPEGIALNFTILPTEEGAAPEVEIAGLKVSLRNNSSAEPIQTLSLPGSITHDGTTYKVTAVGENAFSYERIHSITVGEGIVTLKESSLSSYHLKNVTLPKTLETICRSALSGTGIRTIFIPKSVKAIGDSDTFQSFHRSPLEYISVSSENQNFAAHNGVLYTKDLKTLLYCPEEYSGTLSFPSTINEIAKFAFYENKTIKKLAFPSGLTILIRPQAFMGAMIESVKFTDSSKFVFSTGTFQKCSRLKEVYLGAGVTDIGYGILQDCTSIKDLKISPDNPAYSTDGIAIFDKEQTVLYSIIDSYDGDYILPETLKKIPYQWGWWYGSRVDHLTIPKSVEIIESNAFLAGKIIIENPDVHSLTIGERAFSNATSITVPAEAVEAYKTEWLEYADIINSGDYEMSISANETLSTKKAVLVSVSLKNAEDVIGFQCDIHIPRTASISSDKNNRYAIELSDRAAKTHTMTSGLVTDGTDIYGTGNVIRLVCFSMTNAGIKGNDGVLFRIPITLTSSYNLEGVLLAIDNIHLSKPGNIREDLPWVKKYFKGIDYQPGDADEDGDVSVVDITSAVSHIIGQTPEKFNLAAVDFDKDEVIMINDVTSLVDMVLDFDAAMQAPVHRRRAEAEEQTVAYSMTTPDITAKENSESELKVSMTNEKIIIGFQCDITLPEDVTINQTDDQYDFVLSPERADDHFLASRKVANKPNTVRVVSASLSNAPFAGNGGELFSCPITVDAPSGEYEITISNIILSAEGNERINVPAFTGKLTVSDTSGIESPEISVNPTSDNVRYFDLQGRPVTPTFRGIAVSKNGKILIK